MEVQQALNEYKEYFGVNYFFYIGHEKTDQEIIEEIENCIKTGKSRKNPSMMRISYIRVVHRWQRHRLATITDIQHKNVQGGKV